MAQNDDGNMSGQSPAPNGGDSPRDQAIKQLERKRKFHAEAIGWTIAMVVLVAIWAMSEYHNAGGWPSEGFSQSSSIHHVWNYWIIYPFIAWVVLTAAGALSVYLRKPISEGQIKREIERQGRAR